MGDRHAYALTSFADHENLYGRDLTQYVWVSLSSELLLDKFH